LAAHLREIGELASVVGENLQQPRHLIKLFHVGNFAYIPLQGASQDNGSGGRPAAGPNAETSASPSVLSRHPRNRPLIHFQTRRSQSFQLFALAASHGSMALNAL
jgi:hypothetical protein